VIPNIPTKKARKSAGIGHVKFYLDRSTLAALPTLQVQEVLTLPAARLTAMPNMPACVLGLMNRRAQVMWLVDLPHLLGNAPLETNVQQYSILVVRLGSESLGLAVARIEGTVGLPAELMAPPPTYCQPSLRAYVNGCVIQDAETLWLLDSERLLQSPALNPSMVHAL
jgi:positive phototaxis protein PixI